MLNLLIFLYGMLLLLLTFAFFPFQPLALFFLTLLLFSFNALAFFFGLTLAFFRLLALANLGEQAVNSIELYAQAPTVDTGTTGTPDNEKVFGYQERWAEMRYKPNQISGLFRSTYATPLDSWHLAQEFGSLPTLSQTFIEQNAPMDRVVAVTTEPHFLFDSHFDVRVARPMPVYSVPGLIDHL